MKASAVEYANSTEYYDTLFYFKIRRLADAKKFSFFEKNLSSVFQNIHTQKATVMWTYFYFVRASLKRRRRYQLN